MLDNLIRPHRRNAMTPSSRYAVGILLLVPLYWTLAKTACAEDRTSETYIMSQDGVVVGAHHKQESTSYTVQSIVGQLGPIGLSFSDDGETVLFSGSLVGGSAGFRIGESLPPPPDVNLSQIPGIAPANGAFFVDNVANGPKLVIVNSPGETGEVTVTWAKQGGGSIPVTYRIVDAFVKSPVYFPFDWREIPPEVAVLPNTTIHYNDRIQSEDVEIQNLKFRLITQHPKTGYVIVEYEDDSGNYGGIDIVQIAETDKQPFRGADATVRVAARILPPEGTEDCPPQLTRVGGQGLLYLHDKAGENENNIFATWHNDDPEKAGVFWYTKGANGKTCWPKVYQRYTASWPANPQVHVRGGTPVNFSAHNSANVRLIQHEDDHSSVGTFDGKDFTAARRGWAVFIYQLGFRPGTQVAVQAVRSFENVDLRTDKNWDIGDQITDPDHNALCYDGYMKDGIDVKRRYDPALYNPTTQKGQIFPVNIDDIEVWWYQKTLDVCWPVKPVLYHCGWPSVPEECIVIANEQGTKRFEDDKVFGSPVIYNEYDAISDTQIGFNPNEEHAQWSDGPNSVLHAARDDYNRLEGKSEPYVLVKYQKPVAPGTPKPYEFDVVRVVSQLNEGEVVGGCGCEVKPCRFVYDVTITAISGNLQRPAPIGQNDRNANSGCEQTEIIPEAERWDDLRGNLWYRKGATPVIARHYERWKKADGSYECKPWMDPVRLEENQTQNGSPHEVTYNVHWPRFERSTSKPDAHNGNDYVSLKYGDLHLFPNHKQAEILYNETGASLIYPFRISRVRLDDLPTDYYQLREKLWPHVAKRLSYNILESKLEFSGVEPEPNNPKFYLIGIMTKEELDNILSVFEDNNANRNFRTAAIELYEETQQNGWSTVGTKVGFLDPNWGPDWGIALTAGTANQKGWVVIGLNGNKDLTAPNPNIEVLNVDCLYKGDIQVWEPDCPFSEQLTLRWDGETAAIENGDNCPGVNCAQLYFKWSVRTTAPQDYDSIDPDKKPPGVGDWTPFVYDEGKPESGWRKGLSTLVLSGRNRDPKFALTDSWFKVEVRVPSDDEGYDPTAYPCPQNTTVATEDTFVPGWIKRVKKGVNPYDQKTSRFDWSEVKTYTDVIKQLGPPSSGGIGLSCDADNGLIEIYSEVMRIGRGFTLDHVPAEPYQPANQALLLVAGNLADFHLLLANEAYGDAQDPTIGLDPEVDLPGNPYVVNCFQNLLPGGETALLYEELGLLRGVDSRTKDYDKYPIYNRLPHNFLSGDGQLAYASNYQVTSVEEAEERFPQGHGDAWGHYLTAIRGYYDLLQSPFFSWEPRSEWMKLGSVGQQRDVEVSFLHERKFAKVATAKARCGADIVDLTYRSQYLDSPELQYKGYRDSVPGRDWSVNDWSERSFTGAYFDWLTANAHIPEMDTANHADAVQKVDRSTVPELRELPALAGRIQAKLDEVDAGLNPLGLAKNAIPFDISPSLLELPTQKTHYEQISERAYTAVENAIKVFDYANVLDRQLRQTNITSEKFQRDVADEEVNFNNRLIEIFGYPYPEDINPKTQAPYESSLSWPDVPDLYHFEYVDLGEISGLKDDLPAGETLHASFPILDVDPDQGTLTYGGAVDIEFNVIPGFGLIKPKSFKKPRPAPGEIQLARSDLLQSLWRYKQTLVAYGSRLADIEDASKMLENLYNLHADEIYVLNRVAREQSHLNDKIKQKRKAYLDYRTHAQLSAQSAEAFAEALPKVVGSANDPFAVPRSIIRIVGNIQAQVFSILADQESLAELGLANEKEALNNEKEIRLTTLRNEFEVQQRIVELQQLVRSLVALEIDIYSQQEAMRQASGRYQTAIARGLRLIEDRTRYRTNIAKDVTAFRYQDMAFRVFRNDALQKYRPQFDLAAQYVYLAAKAYDYETNLLYNREGQNTGDTVFNRIVRERVPGRLGEPSLGLAGILEDMDTSFVSVKAALGLNAPVEQARDFSLRGELFRIYRKAGSNENWSQTLENYVISDLRYDDDFNRWCIPYWQNALPVVPQPAIVIPFKTNVTSGLNFFGDDWTVVDNIEDHDFNPTMYSTKIRALGVFFSNYPSGINENPIVYLIPVGADYMRIPGSGEPRAFFVHEQVLLFPNQLNISLLDNNLKYIPFIDSLKPDKDGAPYGFIRRFGGFEARIDQAARLDPKDVTPDKRLIGRSVWNTRWLLIIPGKTLRPDNEQLGIDTFIHGNDGIGTTDIILKVLAYSYSGFTK